MQETDVLTNKQIRYAMIKGKNEKKHPELLPLTRQPLKGTRLKKFMHATVSTANKSSNRNLFIAQNVVYGGNKT
jgi:hypothetical protein